jgi:lactam utilization protein B
MAAVIDLVADLGEGFGHWTMADDRAVLVLVTSGLRWPTDAPRGRDHR